MDDCNCGGHTNELGKWHAISCPATVANRELAALRAEVVAYERRIPELCADYLSQIDKLRAETLGLKRQLVAIKDGHEENLRHLVERTRQLDVASLQVDEISKRLYKIGLMCDAVAGLQDGFCPDIGEPRDNLTRIKIALERFIEKPKDGPCYMCHGSGERGGFPCPECAEKRIRQSCICGPEGKCDYHAITHVEPLTDKRVEGS